MNGKRTLALILLCGLALLGTAGANTGHESGPGAHVIAVAARAKDLSAAVPSIERWVIASGGGSVNAANRSLDSTSGQWVVGSSQAAGDLLSPGFWGGGWDAPRRIPIYLPLVLRD
jgi:hypothetical protein